MQTPKVVYYKDEVNDEFSGDDITPIKIDKNYSYFKTTLWYKIRTFFWYRIIATPLVFCYMKFKFKHKVIGKRKLRQCREGAFLIGNHTHNLCDVSIPTLVSSCKRAYIIANSNNVSIPYLRRVTDSLGAIPLPDDKDATRNFNKCIEKRIKEKSFVMIYPEAHIWPYCTWIRNYPSTSFRYPVLMDTKCYSVTNTYQKRKFSKKPKMVTYIDGPFYPDKELPRKDAQQKLRDEIYETMKKRAELNTVTLVEYIKEENND